MSDTYTNSPIAADPDERAVEEVHCVECGVPISSIPSWYANVNVRFTCDSCRQKSPRLGMAPAPSASGGEQEGVRDSGLLGEVEADTDLGADDVELEEDADLGLDETSEGDEE